MISRIFLSAAVVSAMLLPSVALAQSSDPSWLDDLKDQLQFEKECKVSYLMNMREGELGGKLTYEARVQCEDGRMFDASRTGSDGPFELKACESQVC